MFILSNMDVIITTSQLKQKLASQTVITHFLRLLQHHKIRLVKLYLLMC